MKIIVVDRANPRKFILILSITYSSTARKRISFSFVSPSPMRGSTEIDTFVSVLQGASVRDFLLA